LICCHCSDVIANLDRYMETRGGPSRFLAQIRRSEKKIPFHLLMRRKQPRSDHFSSTAYPSVISRCSQSLAVVHSRLTVIGEVFSARAVSSIVNPVKYRSSTIRAENGSI